jgi:L-lactate utilization protein LutB
MDLTQEMSEYVETKISSELKTINTNMKRFRADVYNTVEQIGNHFHNERLKVDELRTRLERLEHRQTHTGGRPHSNISADDVRDYTESQLDIFRKVMMKMDRQIHDLISETQQDAVKFNSFGFRRVE